MAVQQSKSGMDVFRSGSVLHGSDQQSMKRFSSSTHLEILKPSLLPHMAQVLSESGRISRGYLKRLEECQRRIADTLGFLAA